MMTQSMSRHGSPSESRSARSAPAARARRVPGTKLRSIHDPSFADPTAPGVFLAPSSESVDNAVRHVSETSGWLSPFPADHFGSGRLSHDQEAHLFREMNDLKDRANQLREQLDPDRPSPDDLDEIERLLSESAAVRNRIVESNLRLVVTIAKTRVGSGYGLPECVSDGSLALIQAVDGFDLARGKTFSAYAGFVIRHQLARNRWRSFRRRARSLAPYEETLRASDPGLHEREREEVRDWMRSAIGRWLGRLNERARRVIASHYGLDGTPEQTLAQIGRDLGISTEGVRQIEDRARAKLRKWARLEGFEPPEN